MLFNYKERDKYPYIKEGLRATVNHDKTKSPFKRKLRTIRNY